MKTKVIFLIPVLAFGSSAILAGESPLSCTTKLITEFGITIIDCSISVDKVEIRNAIVNRGKCNNTKSLPMNPLFATGVQWSYGINPKTYEDINQAYSKGNSTKTSSEMGVHGFGDIFRIYTDCTNLIEWTIDTDKESWTFKKN